MNLLQQKLANGITIFDGAIGTEIYRRNFFVNASYEQLNLTSPQVITDIHTRYLKAGAEVLTTNTYNANSRRLAKYGIADQTEVINRAGVKLAREVAGDKALVAASIGPIEEPDSKQDHRTRAELLIEQITALADADFIMFESLRRVVDLKAVIEAVSVFPELAYVVSFAIEPHSHHNTASTLSEFVNVLKTANPIPAPTAIGLNCGGGPESTLDTLEELVAFKLGLPIIVQPNAGQPRGVDGRMIYMTSAEYFDTYAKRYVDLGASAVGGCCGIGPDHIEELVRTIKPLTAAETRSLPEIQVQEADLKPEIPLSKRSKLGAKLVSGSFIKLVEITPPRGFDLTKTLAGATQCQKAGIDAVNLPDGPRASARISSLITALEIQRSVGIETILHCCSRDRSLIGLQSELLGCAGVGVCNILFITGDPPKLGDYPFSSGVFDTDSIGMVKIQTRMNRGIDLGGLPLNAPTSAVIGVGADPSAVNLEREYRRACEKVEAGAEFIITQPVFAIEPLFRFLDQIEHLKVPVIAGIWPLTSLRNAEFMRTEVPGVVVPDEVMSRMAEAETKEAQREAGIEIARECYAKVRTRVQGIQVSAPFGNVDTALRVHAE